jgi:hypothetical protein
MTPAALFVSLILTLAPAPPDSQTCSLPGLWLGQNRDQNSIGMWLEFAPDGSVVRAQGKMVDGRWELKGDTLTLSSQSAIATEGEGVERYTVTQKVAVKVTGDAATRKAEAAVVEVPKQEVRTRRGTSERSVRPPVLPQPAITVLEEQPLTRVMAAEPNEPAIVGIWGYKNKTGRPVLERYTASRKFAVLEPLGAQRGTFKVEGTTLSVTADGNTTNVPITCASDYFELDVNGTKMRFVKFQ